MGHLPSPTPLRAFSMAQPAYYQSLFLAPPSVGGRRRLPTSTVTPLLLQTKNMKRPANDLESGQSHGEVCSKCFRSRSSHISEEIRRRIRDRLLLGESQQRNRSANTGGTLPSKVSLAVSLDHFGSRSIDDIHNPQRRTSSKFLPAYSATQPYLH